MAEWLYEAGIGEARAALVDGDRIIEARIERDDTALRCGAIVRATLRRKTGRAGRGEVETEDGETALLAPVPANITEGAILLVEIVREAIPERGNPKLPLARPSDAAEPRPAPALWESLDGPVRILRPHEPDALEQCGWSEALEQAQTGQIPFLGGLLRIALTPAMTVIDVDGELPPAELAIRGAAAAGAAIRGFGISGSIGIDLPTMPDKRARQAAAEALDGALPQPFERTAVNGFGFLQIVRRRVRPSLLELLQSDPIRSAAAALLRRLERERLPGRTLLSVGPPVAALFESHPDWIEELARRTGASIAVVGDAGLSLSAYTVMPAG